MISTIHDRMPVILHPEDYTRWLSRSGARPAHLLKPFPSDLLTMWPRSSLPICFPWDDLAVGGRHMATKLSEGDSIAMRGEVTMLHDDGSVTVWLHDYGVPITRTSESGGEEEGRRKPLYDKPD
jgi:hypothetical protein